MAAMGLVRLAEITTYGRDSGRFGVTGTVSSNLIVTPAMTASGTLKLITRAFANSGALTRVGHSGDLGAGAAITGVATPTRSMPADVCGVERANGIR